MESVVSRSQMIYEEARKVLPGGGVNSPVRAFNAVDASPIFAKKRSWV